MSGQKSSDDVLLFIMRHGEAESPRRDDKSRQLTEVGRYQAAQAARWLIDSYSPDASVDLALVSPYKRALQTFEEVNKSVSVSKKEIFDDITPDGDPTGVSEYIAARTSLALAKDKSLNSVLVVSHMPLVSYLVDALCKTYTTSLFATASIAVIRYDVKRSIGRVLYHYQG